VELVPMRQPGEPMSMGAMLFGAVDLLVSTYPVAEVIEQVFDWLTGGLLGGAIVGRPRLGKTRAVRFCLKALPRIINVKFPWIEIPLRFLNERTCRCEDDFFTYLLDCVGSTEKRGSTGAKRNRFVEYCNSQASRSEARLMVLFLDEGQKLSALHLTWLLECGNEVDQKGARLFLLFAAQPEFKELKASLLEQGKSEQYVARYFSADHDFRGLKSEEELKHCFGNYSTAQYPPGSGRSFASNYLDGAPNPNLNIASLSGLFWREFEIVWNSTRVGSPVEVGMHYVSGSLIKFLNLRRDPKHWEVPDHELVHEAVIHSHFSDAVANGQGAEAPGKI